MSGDRSAPVAYRGRFAPSPTGSLHFGSLVAAVGSYADARARDGAWLVRIEDLDRARMVPGAAAAILHVLDALGLHWDGPVWYQSQRLPAYADALADLRRQGLTYPCACSRAAIAVHGYPGSEGPRYPGTCRSGLPRGASARSERVLTTATPFVIDDRIQGRLVQNIAAEVGDFVVRRADGIIAYQLAVITDIVRGADLLHSTPRQCYLQQCLGLPRPRYAHLPLVVDAMGRKLSKSQADLPIDSARPLPALRAAWRFLGQAAIAEECGDIAAFWARAIATWNPNAIPDRGAAMPGG